MDLYASCKESQLVAVHQVVISLCSPKGKERFRHTTMHTQNHAKENRRTSCAPPPQILSLGEVV